MAHTVELASGGKAEFSNEYIQIEDKKERRNYWLFLASSLLWIPTSLMFLAADDFNFDRWINWVWLFNFVAHLIIGPLQIFRTSFQNMVWLDEVKSAKVSTGYKDATLTLKLKNGKLRRIRAKYEYVKDFRSFISTNNLKK